MDHKELVNFIAEPIKSDNEDEKKSLDRWFDKINYKSELKVLTRCSSLETTIIIIIIDFFALADNFRGFKSKPPCSS